MFVCRTIMRHENDAVRICMNLRKSKAKDFDCVAVKAIQEGLSDFARSP